MPGIQPVEANDTIYLYDGTLDGFFCCVYESVYEREMPYAIECAAQAQPTLFETRAIYTHGPKAARVRESIPKKICPEALELIGHVYHSCLPQRELAMLRFLRLGYRTGPSIMDMLGHPDVSVMLKAQRHLLGEVHLLTGFIRFSDYDGFLGAQITPKNFVLPYLAGHFCDRLSTENYLIYDKTHKAALMYENGQVSLFEVDHIEFDAPHAAELQYRALWKQFYNTIAIEARTNPRCRMTHLPKRYWENMIEMQELL